MAEAMHNSEIQEEMPNDMNHTHTSAQEMVRLQPLVSSQPASASSSGVSKQQHVEDQLIVDVKKLVQDCRHGSLPRDRCIYNVPVRIYNRGRDIYTPKIVSIGPFHYHHRWLQNMERHKELLFKEFTQRAKSRLDDLVHLVESLEPKVRASYSEHIRWDKQFFVKLILVDAGFIIELFILSYKQQPKSQSWLVNYIFEDLLLLENQLPFFVIEELFNKAFPPDCDSGLPSFLVLTYEYFWYYNRQKLEPNPDVKIKHFTDLLRLFYLPKTMPEQKPSAEAGRHILLYNVNALQEKGIKLKAGASKYLLDLKFSGHTLEIPQIQVDDTTEVLFRNMIAFEQCHYMDGTHLTDYFLLLDCLIDTYKDVDLLVQEKVVRNYLGDSKNVALVFDGLGGNFTRLGFNVEYLRICKELNDYCKNPWRKMKASLRRDYCNTPWRTVASIAGIILLVLTIVQTIFSVLQVVLQK